MGRNKKMRLRGDRIRGLREALKWSQNDLAIRVGSPASTIHRYETEPDKKPPAHTLLAIAQVLGVSLEYLLDLTDDPAMTANEKGLPPGWQETVRELIELHYSPEAAVSILRALRPIVKDDLNS